MWVCPKCAVNVYGENCHLCGRGQNDPDPAAIDYEAPVACPICGEVAERGCVYEAGRGWSMRWYAGPPSFWANLATAFGGGESVSDWQLGSGPYIPGIRCERCRRIVLEY